MKAKGLSLYICVGKPAKSRFEFGKFGFRLVFYWFAVCVYRTDLDFLIGGILEENKRLKGKV